MSRLSKHFMREEFACHCGCGGDTVDAELITVLEDLRAAFNKPVRITSGYRCEKHNKAVGGAAESYHRVGKATDVTVDDEPPEVVAEYLEGRYVGRYGIGRYKRWTHIDVREKMARW